MAGGIDEQIHFKQTALNLRAFRQELLASNIANADTPNFKARDFEFKSALAGALGKTQAGTLALTRTSPAHLAAAASNSYGVNVQYRTEFQPSVDGNTVNMDVERAAFAENAIQMEALMAHVSSEFKTQNAALQP